MYLVLELKKTINNYKSQLDPSYYSPPLSTQTDSANTQYQSCVLLCLNALLTFLPFSDPPACHFLNEELLPCIANYLATPLWSEALDLLKLTVGKSSSLTAASSAAKPAPNPTFFLATPVDSKASNLSAAQQIPAQSFFSKKELPGRTLEFDFDFAMFVPSLANTATPTKAG